MSVNYPGFYTALEGLKETLVENWAAKIATIDAARLIKIRSRKVEAYTAAGNIVFDIDGADYTWTVAAAADNAATMAAQVNTQIGPMNAQDVGGRVVLQLAADPSDGSDHRLLIKSETLGAANDMGFHVGDEEHRAPLRQLERDGFYDYIPEVYGPFPMLVVQEAVILGEENLRPKAKYWVQVRCTFEDLYEGARYRPVQDMMAGYSQAIREIITENRKLGGAAVTSRIDRMNLVPRLYQQQDRGPVAGELPFDILIRLYNA